MTSDPSPPPRRSRHIGLWTLGGVVVAAGVLVAVWDWDWFLPIVERQASSTIGRKVTAEHMHVALGRITTVTLDKVVIATGDGFDAATPFATTDKLVVTADVLAYLKSRQIVIPQIELDHPVVDAEQKPDGSATWPAFGGSTPKGKDADPNAGPKIGDLVIHDGSVKVVIPKLKADFALAVATQGATGTDGQSNASKIVVDAKGRYADQPITGKLIGGALLSLRDAADPYPIDLQLENGPTKVSLTGTVQNPLNFAGADLKLRLSGPDGALLTPLTGVPIPQTPPYNIAGNLDYAERKIRFTHFTGKLGESDLNGDILVDPTQPKLFVDADLFSHQVQLADLGGFIGAAPGKKSEAGQTPQQRAALEKKESSDQILPDVPISLPKLDMANVKLRYKGEHILGRSVPLDNIVAAIDITDGAVKVDPLSFKVGTGAIKLTAALEPAKDGEVKADIAVGFDKMDLTRLLAATHLVEGAGAMSGNARLVSTGKSLAELLGHGDGGLQLGMSGGNLSALLADLAGLEFGNAILSALGVPSRAQLRCLAAGFVLYKGVLGTRRLIIDTSETQIQGGGAINFADETIEYQILARSTHFSVGSLSTPINITGHLKSPHIAPAIGPLALKAGAAIGLGILFPPAAILPTIQLGVGDDDKGCLDAEAVYSRTSPPAVKAANGVAAPPVKAAPATRRR